jgi:hypothetical protein
MADTADWTATIFGVAADDVTDLEDWTWAVYGAGGTFAPSGGAGGVPEPPVTGYVARWDATAITATADGGLLSTWPDLSINRYDLTQSSAGSQPTYYNTSPGFLVNGRPAVWFSGAQIMVTATGPTFGEPYTVIGVGYDTHTTNDYLWSSGGNTSLPAVYQTLIPSWGFVAGAAQYSSYPVSRGSPNFVAAVFNGTSSLLQSDGDIFTPGVGVGGYTPTDYMCVGDHHIRGQGWWGPICEIILYKGALSLADRNALRSYAQAKWGTP